MFLPSVDCWTSVAEGHKLTLRVGTLESCFTGHLLSFTSALPLILLLLLSCLLPLVDRLNSLPDDTFSFILVHGLASLVITKADLSPGPQQQVIPSALLATDKSVCKKAENAGEMVVTYADYMTKRIAGHTRKHTHTHTHKHTCTHMHIYTCTQSC